MAAMSDYLENKLIDQLFRGQAFSFPATLHFALLTVNTDDDGSPLTEVSGGSYARAAVTASLANFAGTQAAGSTVASSGASGTTSNNGTITFPAPTANWGVIVGVAIYDAASGGNMLIYSPLTTNKTVNSGDSAPSFAAGQFTFQIDN
jgi:hypothetical protein